MAAAVLENNSGDSERSSDGKEVKEVKEEEEDEDSKDRCRTDLKQNFVLPSDFYKNLLERAVFSKNGDPEDKNSFNSSVPVFPRNLLYSNYNPEHSGSPSSPNEVRSTLTPAGRVRPSNGFSFLSSVAESRVRVEPGSEPPKR